MKSVTILLAAVQPVPYKPHHTFVCDSRDVITAVFDEQVFSIGEMRVIRWEDDRFETPQAAVVDFLKNELLAEDITPEGRLPPEAIPIIWKHFGHTL